MSVYIQHIKHVIVIALKLLTAIKNKQQHNKIFSRDQTYAHTVQSMTN